MRPAQALWMVLVVSSPVFAQPSVMLGEVVVDSTPLRAGPSHELPETGTVFRGARVYIAHDEGEHWVAIEPPPGQFSWIRSLHLEPIGGEDTARLLRWNAWVRAEPTAELAFGRPGFDKPLDVRRTRLPEATIVSVVGTKVTYNGVAWYPIAAPYGDYRYVPKTSVKVLRPVAAQAYVVKSPVPKSAEPSVSLEPAAAAVPNRSGSGLSHPLWTQAEQAERDGDYTRAETLFLRLAAEMNQPGGDVAIANQCYTRVHGVREKQRQSSRRDAPAIPGSTPIPTPERTRREEPEGERWIGPGVLRPAGFRLDNKPTYALVGSRGDVLCYAVAGPKLDLERFRGFDVELFGTITNASQLRGVPALTASKAQAVR